MSSIFGNNQMLASPSEPVQKETGAVADKSAKEEESYSQILMSTALVGGSSAIKIAIGIVRTKTMAILLGPSGLGLFGLYGSITNLTQSIVGMGVNSSGVRQIADAVGTGDIERVRRTATVLRRTSILLGALGAALLVAFSKRVSMITFGSDQRASAVRLLSLAVFLSLVSDGQGALIQGMRRISDLARISVWGALFGTVITIVLVYFLRERGVALSIVAFAAMSIATSWWYSRKAGVPTLSISVFRVWHDAGDLLKLGFAFMTSGLMMTWSAYAVRTIVLHKISLEATGLYQSAWTLGGLYVGIVLQSMGADFYPRLTACARNDAKCNRLVNEQARVSLLLAGPGVIATLTFAPVVIALFYAAKFGAAVGLLRWICLGVTMQVISWPMGFIIVAKGQQGLFFWSELAWTLVHVTLAWICVEHFGLIGAGIAFFGSYVFHVILIYAIVSRSSGFRWSSDNRQSGALFLVSIGAVFCGFYLLPFLMAVALGTVTMILTCVYSGRILITLVSSARLPAVISRVLSGFGLRASRCVS
jgi:PST family polysaccharide transporter